MQPWKRTIWWLKCQKTFKSLIRIEAEMNGKGNSAQILRTVFTLRTKNMLKTTKLSDSILGLLSI